MKPFSALKVRYTNKKMGEIEKRAIFDKLVDGKFTESFNFQADPDFSLVFFRAPIDVIRTLTRRPQPGILLTVHIDDFSKTLDPNVLTVEIKPFSLKSRVKEDVEECGGVVVDQTLKPSGTLLYTCDFGDFHKCAIAFEKLNPHYYLHFNKINPEDLWKHEIINDLSIKSSPKQKLASKDQEDLSPSTPLPDILPCVPPTPPISTYNTTYCVAPQQTIKQERRFKFYIKVRNDSVSVSKLDEFVHEIDGYKSSMIMDSIDDPKWRYIRAEFETDEQTEDAYNLIQLLPVETKVHYFHDFLK